MREVLFRGKRKDNGEWVYGNYCGVEYLEGDGIEHLIIEIPRNGFSVHVIPETVGQYTGLTDKNGKKIFEGDIVNSDGNFCVVRYGKHLIDCCGCCYNSHASVGFYLERDGDSEKVIVADYDAWDGLDIIGNIHDNPELLKGGEQE